MSDEITACPICEYYEGSLTKIDKDTFQCSGCNNQWMIKKV